MVVESNMREMMMETVCTGPVSHTGSSCCIARSPATLFSLSGTELCIGARAETMFWSEYHLYVTWSSDC